jgi:hypothetical protein
MVKIQDLERINAVVDTRGSYIDGKFCPVELSVVGRYFYRHYPLCTNIDRERSPLISYLQDLIGDQPSLVFGVKHTHLAKTLTSHGIPFVDLTDPREIRVPTLKELDIATLEPRWRCEGHTQKGLRCSARKASRLWDWIQTRVSCPSTDSSDWEGGCGDSDYFNCDYCQRSTLGKCKCGD